VSRMNGRNDSMDKRSILVWGVKEAICRRQVLGVLTNAGLVNKVATVEEVKRIGLLTKHARRIQIVAKSTLDRDSLYVLAKPVFSGRSWHCTKSQNHADRALARARANAGIPSSQPLPLAAAPAARSPNSTAIAVSQPMNYYSVLDNSADSEEQADSADEEVLADGVEAVASSRQVRANSVIVDDDLSGGPLEGEQSDDDEAPLLEPVEH
jgi:hypothetical protein